MSTLSRRTFLAAGAGLVVAAACGSKGSGSTASGAGGSSGSSSGANAFVARFADGTFVPGNQRVAVSLANTAGLVSDNTPATITAKVTTQDGKVVVPEVRADRHDKGLPVPYWPFLLQLPSTGVYQLVATVDAKELTQAFSVVDPSAVKIPLVGSALPPFDTPTTTDARGVNPICTRKPPCPLHDITLTEALTKGKPVAYLIATPAYCQTGVCGPILDFLLAAHTTLGDKATMVHAEVYRDSTASTTAPAVDAYHMTFEPSLFVADATGKIVERLDFVFDEGEIVAALKKAGVS